MKPKAFVIVLLLAFSASAQPLPPGSSLFGETLGDWSAEWVKWIYPTCTNENPALDPDGRLAGFGQPQIPVFLLAGVYYFSASVDRTITVPENRYIFFPLFNVWVDNIGANPPWPLEQLRDVETAYINGVEQLEAVLDGSAIPDLFSYRAASPVFSINFTNPCNLVSSFVLQMPFTGLNDPILADGYYLMIEPLPVGHNLLIFGGARGAPDFFSTHSTAHIEVIPVPLAQWVAELINVLENAGLSDQQKKQFLLHLQNAQKAFSGGNVRSSINHLRVFEQTVGRLTIANSDLARDIISYSQRTIERAERELARPGLGRVVENPF